jgi:hypothetical protein
VNGGSHINSKALEDCVLYVRAEAVLRMESRSQNSREPLACAAVLGFGFLLKLLRLVPAAGAR